MHTWINCQQCGKRLLQRKSNGIFIFRFGRSSSQESFVEMEIMGSIRMKCFRRGCGFTNTINFFPEHFTVKGE